VLSCAVLRALFVLCIRVFCQTFVFIPWNPPGNQIFWAKKLTENFNFFQRFEANFAQVCEVLAGVAALRFAPCVFSRYFIYIIFLSFDRWLLPKHRHRIYPAALYYRGPVFEHGGPVATVHFISLSALEDTRTTATIPDLNYPSLACVACLRTWPRPNMI
jgi:hypothetical protein